MHPLPPKNSLENRRAELPVPSAAEQAHSAQLTAHMEDLLKKSSHTMDFAHFMELALYTPGLGYYSAGLRKFGPAGDFITAPELGPLFAQSLARQVAQVFAQLKTGALLEFGAGSGALAAELLPALAALNCLPEHYYILELSAALRARQAERLQQLDPALAARVSWLEQLPTEKFRGVVIANEVLDAMPVQRFRLTAESLDWLQVARQDNHWVWQARPADEASSQQIKSRLQGLVLPAGYTSEINSQAEAWVRSLGEMLAAGAAFIIDYGFPRHEFYHPQRSQGTLMCHYRHHNHDNPLILVGLQDITAHVEFTALAEAAVEVGLKVLGYTNQAAFLLACGITDLAQGAQDEKTRLQHAQEIKKLTLPHEMGELFKVMALGRGIETPLLGFQLQDQRGRL